VLTENMILINWDSSDNEVSGRSR